MGKLWIYANDQNTLLNINSTNCRLERVCLLHLFFVLCFSTELPLRKPFLKVNICSTAKLSNRSCPSLTKMKMSCHMAENSVPTTAATKSVFTNPAEV